ncbi:outer membrane protein assembly factor BamA [Candidatus Pelagibacter sp.]|nr:outer membrane protein assembly factor BamA [Candidatus Pelagibacter sp.]
MFKTFIKINFILLFISSLSVAQIINDINVSGNKRISKESIVVFGDIDFDKEYNDDDLNIILKNIYETNFFKEINLRINNSILEISVIENPIIENVQIDGIKSEKLTELLMDKIKLKNRSSYIESSFLSDLNLVKNILKNSGYYFAKVITRSTLNEEQNSIRLAYDIDLGKRAKIQEIQFIGDKKIKDRKLKNIITSEEAKFWKFISQSVYLNYERIELDKRLLTNFYKNNGYYNVDISNSFVEFNNNNSFKLIYNINSGKKFKFNELTLNLSDDYDSKYFIKINKYLENLRDQEYSLNKIEKILREVDKIALSKQYQFIDASLEETIIDNDKLNISISLKDNEKFYVEKINILGNNYTIEEVIRNSLIVDEGDPYNEILFNKSINNIKAKSIFSKVETDIIPGSSEGLKIVNLTVEEKPTGEISLGAGVGTTGGTIGGGIKENNFLGKGIKLNTNVQISENSVKGQFIYEKPNFNYSDNSLFTSLRSTTTDNIKDFGHKTSDLGLSLGTSFEQFENLYFRPELDISYEKIETTSAASSSLKKQEGDYFDTFFNYSLDYDLRNKRYRPDEGYRNIFSQQLPLVSDNYEIVNSFESTRYQKISEMVTKVSFYGKAVNALNNEDVRISKRLFMPSSKLRGFESGKIGPVENSDYIGGNYISALNFSATLPKLLPSFQNMDFSFFVDAANVWGVDYDSTIDDNNKIRSATGVAMDILTPVGPLNFSLSQPITKNSTDKTESFRFNLGTTF